MAKAKREIPEEKLTLYEKLIVNMDEVTIKGAASAYTSCNGHMFSFMTKEGILALRLPKEEREAFLEKFDTKLSVQYNTVMKEYVEVPDELLQNTHEKAETLFQEELRLCFLVKAKADYTKKERIKGV